MSRQHKSQFLQSLACGLLAAIAVLGILSRAHAAEPSQAEAMSFAVLDLNQDGFVDKREASVLPSLLDAFDAVDTNKDGRLSPSEYAKATTQSPS